uniref:alpha/beta hydrolase n=1 Tax=Roseivirga sp. TaxID=1964215 RepID=UPI0040473D86
MNIYCLSGLGADNSVFQFLSIPNVKFHFVDWIEPRPNEALKNYSKRLFENINLELPYSFLGVSFGGMIALEVASISSPTHCFSISSAVNRKELPWVYQWVLKTRVHSALPDFIFKKADPVLFHAFGLKSKAERLHFKTILRNTDVQFLKWALGSISSWEGQNSEKVISIHGTKDRVIPLPKRKVDLIIEGGSHVIVVQAAGVISDFIVEILKTD